MDAKMWLLLPVCSLLTGLITQAIKKMIPLKDDEYSKNILAGVVSIVVAVAVSAGYMIMNDLAVTKVSVVYIVELIVLSWLCAEDGYDRVSQTLGQIGKKGDDDSAE